MAKIQTATAVTRQVMRSFGKTELFSNKYAHCRTVKCYASDSLKQDSKMMKAIKTAVAGINGKILDIDYHYPTTEGFREPRMAIIVRFPL